MEDASRILEEWDVNILLDDHITTLPVTVQLIGKDDGIIQDVTVKTQNGLKHYGERRGY